MVDDARHVAETGQDSYGPGHHTGYHLPPSGPGSTDGPCGAYLVTDTGNAYLPDDPGGFVHENGSRLSMGAGGTSKRGHVDVHEFGRHPRCRPVEHRAARGT